jgi:hypothetical protein
MEKLGNALALDVPARVNTKENVRLAFDQKVSTSSRRSSVPIFELHRRITDDVRSASRSRISSSITTCAATGNAEELIKRGESETQEVCRCRERDVSSTRLP